MPKNIRLLGRICRLQTRVFYNQYIVEENKKDRVKNGNFLFRENTVIDKPQSGKYRLWVGKVYS